MSILQINQLNRISLSIALPRHQPQQHALPLLPLLLEHILFCPEIAVNFSPLGFLVVAGCPLEWFVDEVASLSVEAVPIDHEGEAGPSLIGVIVWHVVS